jgi:hypothetical protein
MDYLSPVKEYGGCVVGGLVLAVSSVAAVLTSPEAKAHASPSMDQSATKKRKINEDSSHSRAIELYNRMYEEAIRDKSKLVLAPRMEDHYRELKQSLAEIGVEVDASRSEYTTIDLRFLLENDLSHEAEKRLFLDLLEIGGMLLQPASSASATAAAVGDTAAAALGCFRLTSIPLDKSQIAKIRSGLKRVIDMRRTDEQMQPLKKQSKTL